MSVLAVIPARGGSKGIKRKNLTPFDGQPLIVHSIRHAQQSRTISRIVVSTDDDEIRECALRHGAEVPFVRPKALSGDEVLDLPVFQHALHYLREMEHYIPEFVVHLRPTTPHRRPEWIDQALEALAKCPDADSVRSVSPPSQHPYRMFRLGPDGFLSPLMNHEHPAPHVLRRQDLPPLYYYNCVIDVTRPDTILQQGSMTGKKILPFVMNPDDVVDIDSSRDLRIAECLYGSANEQRSWTPPASIAASSGLPSGKAS